MLFIVFYSNKYCNHI